MQSEELWHSITFMQKEIVYTKKRKKKERQ
jgi:hypothetical protein